MGQNPVSLLEGARPPLPSRDLIAGIVAANTAATPLPTGFDQPVYVVLPDHTTDLAYALSWPAIHGAAMPLAGATVLVAFDNRGQPHVISWTGAHA